MGDTTILDPDLMAARRWFAQRLAFERFLARASADALGVAEPELATADAA